MIREEDGLLKMNEHENGKRKEFTMDWDYFSSITQRIRRPLISRGADRLTPLLACYSVFQETMMKP